MQSIGRSLDGMPTIFETKIEDGCMFENTAGGIGTLIIDRDFINEMKIIANEVKDDKSLISLFTNIYNKIINYFSSSIVNNKSREQTYENNEVIDDEGMIIGTKISSLKGKNISKCSEKSLAAYIILEELYSMGIITRKPVLTLSQLSTDSTEAEPHAFVMLNSDKLDNSNKHLLFDVENLTLVENKSGNQEYYVGLYYLNDEQYNNFFNGLQCSPTSLYEILGNYREVGSKRTYGNVKPVKTL